MHCILITDLIWEVRNKKSTVAFKEVFHLQREWFCVQNEPLGSVQFSPMIAIIWTANDMYSVIMIIATNDMYTRFILNLNKHSVNIYYYVS